MISHISDWSILVPAATHWAPFGAYWGSVEPTNRFELHWVPIWTHLPQSHRGDRTGTLVNTSQITALILPTSHRKRVFRDGSYETGRPPARPTRLPVRPVRMYISSFLCLYEKSVFSRSRFFLPI